MKLIYREMKESDLKESALLFVESFSLEPWNENWTYEQAYERLNQLFLCPCFLGYVLYDEEKLVGIACGRVLTYMDYKEMTLEELCVSQDYQGKRLGSKILDYLKEQLLKRNVSSLMLYTLKGALSEKFYQKNGFELKDDSACMIYKLK